MYISLSKLEEIFKFRLCKNTVMWNEITTWKEIAHHWWLKNCSKRQAAMMLLLSRSTSKIYKTEFKWALASLLSMKFYRVYGNKNVQCFVHLYNSLTLSCNVNPTCTPWWSSSWTREIYTPGEIQYMSVAGVQRLEQALGILPYERIQLAEKA